jgi:hypothetical protein
MGNRTVFTGKMPVPRLKTSISQLPFSRNIQQSAVSPQHGAISGRQSKI